MTKGIERTRCRWIARLGGGVDIRIIQVLLGHNSLSTTARYIHVATSTIAGTQSPFDRLTLVVVPPA